MSIIFQTIRVDVPLGSGRRSDYWESRPFPSQPKNAAVSIAGFRLEYEDTDHHVKNVEVDADFVGTVTQPTNLVIFRVECNLADKNGDDSFTGYVDVLVIAEVSDVPDIRLPGEFEGDAGVAPGGADASG